MDGAALTGLQIILALIALSAGLGWAFVSWYGQAWDGSGEGLLAVLGLLVAASAAALIWWAA